ncbi:MAG: zinc-binding dehydrogenase [Sedimentisphaerales bacterium]
MKAAIIEKPNVLAVRNIPVPPVGEYDALCEMLYGATCVGTDWSLISGRLPVEYPAVLGHESIGRVIKTGARVKNFRIGDVITRVGTPASLQGDFGVCWGGFVEYGIAHDHRAMCIDGLPYPQWKSFRVNQIVPPDIDPADATMFITWRETLSYLKRMGVSAGSRVLIIGSGGDGLAFAVHAKNLDSEQVVMIGNDTRRDSARSVGVTDYFNYRLDNVVEQISQKYPQGFDFIIDAVGKKGLADSVLCILKPGGIIGIYGIEDYCQSLLNPTNSRGTFTCYNGGYDEAETHDDIVSFIRRGLLDARLWLDFDNIFSLDSINNAFEAVRKRQMVKALIQLSLHSA